MSDVLVSRKYLQHNTCPQLGLSSEAILFYICYMQSSCSGMLSLLDEPRLVISPQSTLHGEVVSPSCCMFGAPGHSCPSIIA